MVIDGRTLGSADQLETDVCIVGAGPAGITLALELGRSGCRVCLLESGGQKPDAASAKLSRGRSVGYWYPPLPSTRGRAVGGTSLRWFSSDAEQAEGWRARPLDPVDFEARKEMPYSGWPFGYAELRPFYEQAQRVCRLGPYDYTTERWETAGAAALPLDGDLRSAIFQHGYEGFAFFDDLSRSEGVRLVVNASAVEIVTAGPTGGVTEILAAHERSAQFRVKARLYVLAAGGIDNPRLLLLSRRSEPAGLGNGEGQVGRFFMERLSARTGLITPARDDLLDRIAIYGQHSVGDTSVKAVLCLSADAIRRDGLLNCCFYLVPGSRAESSNGVRAAATLLRALHRRPLPGGLAGSVVTALSGAPDLVRARSGLGRDPRAAVVALRVQAEQSPNPDSRVLLDDARDSFGLPRARLDWRISERDHWSIRRTQEILDAELRSRGLGRVEQKLGEERPAVLFLGNHHQMGTTRMHENPRQGVVDPNCQVHGVENLFVAGGSVFPTSGFANPTLTIVALALRLADHLRERLAA